MGLDYVLEQSGSLLAKVPHVIGLSLSAICYAIVLPLSVDPEDYVERGYLEEEANLAQKCLLYEIKAHYKFIIGDPTWKKDMKKSSLTGQICKLERKRQKKFYKNLNEQA